MAPEYSYNAVNQKEFAHDHDSDAIESEDIIFRSSSHSNWYFLYIGAVVILIILSFVSGSLLHPFSLPSQSTQGSHYAAPHQDENGTRAFVPEFPIEIKTFELNETFAGDPSEEVTAAWVSLIPKGQGAIQVPIRNRFDNEVYNIAAFHGIHCLYTLRQSFFAFHQMATTSADRSVAESTYMLKHGSHCIEYIRQQLICNPDLTLEPVDMSNGNPKEWGIERRCLNFDEVSEWARTKRSNDEDGIV